MLFLLEKLCKDFLETIIHNKAYDIKMSLLDIVKVPIDEDLRLKEADDIIKE